MTKYFFEKKFFGNMFLQLALLPPLGHKEALKLQDLLAGHYSAHKQTHTGLFL